MAVFVVEMPAVLSTVGMKTKFQRFRHRTTAPQANKLQIKYRALFKPSDFDLLDLRAWNFRHGEAAGLLFVSR
jgi:hypothetical protein